MANIPEDVKETEEKTSVFELLLGLVIFIGLASLIIWVVFSLFQGGSKPSKSAHKVAVHKSVPKLTADPVKVWDNNNNWMFGVLSQDLDGIQAANSNSSMIKACSSLGNDMQTFQAATPIPDPGLEQTWSVLLSHFSTLSKDCVQGLQTQDQNLLNQIPPIEQQTGSEITSLHQGLRAHGGL